MPIEDSNTSLQPAADDARAGESDHLDIYLAELQAKLTRLRGRRRLFPFFFFAAFALLAIGASAFGLVPPSSISPTDLIAWIVKLSGNPQFATLLGGLVIAAIACRCSAMRGSALISTICLFLLLGPTRAQTGMDTPVPEARGSPKSLKPQLLFDTTINPEPALLSRLQVLFASYFDQSADLTALSEEFVIGSAVTRVPNVGQILYNPAHMLFLHFPEDWQRGGPIRVATLDAVRAILKKPKPPSALLAAYREGFIEFALLTELMKERDTRETLEIVWNTAPQSDADKLRMAYLLLRPIEQAVEVREQSLGCRQAINRFVDEVRAGKRNAIGTVPGLTGSVRPTRFIRDNKQILLVLSDPLMARYHVIARFDVTAANCTVAWETSVFGM